MMFSDYAVSLHDVSKSFRSYRRPQDRFWQGFFHKRKMAVDHHVLKKINLNIPRGKTVGLIGLNGAGKSTLLALICGIYEPSSGTVETNGQIGALLDLGTGFNSELTGRENLYLVASIRGFSRSYVSARLAQILDFADIGEAIDQPVRIYSTGMYMRLAFSLVVHLKPDMLVIDEALAVGDEAFQSKCYGYLRQLSDDGVTIIFVSHATHLILQLCDVAVLLDRGEIIAQGEPRQIVDLYHKLIYAPAAEAPEVRRQIKGGLWAGSSIADTGLDSSGVGQPVTGLFDPDLLHEFSTRFVSQGARIFSPHMTDTNDAPVNVLVPHQVYRFRFRVSFCKTISAVRFGMLIKTSTGLELGGRETSDQLQSVSTGDTREVCFEFRCQLAAGIYFLNAGVLGMINDSEAFLDRLIDAVQFRVLPVESFQTGTVDFAIAASIVKAPEPDEVLSDPALPVDRI